jgi:hypothetical protein
MRDENLICKFRCMRCGFYFENFQPGPTECKKCGHFYVEWLNAEEVLDYIHRIEGWE